MIRASSRRFETVFSPAQQNASSHTAQQNFSRPASPPAAGTSQAPRSNSGVFCDTSENANKELSRWQPESPALQAVSERVLRRPQDAWTDPRARGFGQCPPQATRNMVQEKQLSSFKESAWLISSRMSSFPLRTWRCQSQSGTSHRTSPRGHRTR